MGDAGTKTITQAASPAFQPPILYVRATKGWRTLDLRELWEYRELLYFLTWRNVKVRYKQTILGMFWAILQPVFSMVVFSVIFGHMAKMRSEGVPYAIWNFAGLVPWIFFANGVTQSSNSLVGSGHLLTKVYFPRLAIPLSTVFAGVVDFLLSFVVLLFMMPFFHIYPSATIIFLPLFLALAFATALGVGLWCSGLNVQYRDVAFVLPFVVQAWMFLSPVVYSSSEIPARWQLLYALNPMVAVVEGFRWALLGLQPVAPAVLALSAGMGIMLLVSGAYYFRRLERFFSDVI